MAKIDTKTNKGNAKGDLIFEFPSSEKIIIDKTYLKGELAYFKKVVLNSFNERNVLNFAISIVAVWLPIFTSDFKKILNFDPLTIRGGYAVFSIIITIYFVFQFIWRPLSLLIWGEKNASPDSEKMAQIILDKCNKR